MGRESWGTPPFRGREWEADTDGGGKMMEAADKKEKSMISYAGSRQRQGRGCPVLGTVIIRRSRPTASPPGNLQKCQFWGPEGVRRGREGALLQPAPRGVREAGGLGDTGQLCDEKAVGTAYTGSQPRQH